MSDSEKKNAESSKDTEKAEGQITFDSNGYLAFSPNDPDDPKTWSKARRWYITMVTLTMVVNCSFASSAPTGALVGICKTFKISLVAGNLVTTLFLLGYCAGPVLWAPLSEHYGRRYIFYASFGAYFAFTFLCAWAPNFGSLLAGRLLTGTFASSALSNGPGLLADLWDPIDRGNAMALLIMFTFIGPVLGPVTSGFLELTVGWRWTFYELLWFAAISIILLPTLPETLPSRRLTIKARRLRTEAARHEQVFSPQEGKDERLMAVLKRSLLRPFLIFTDPIAFCLTIYTAIVYAILYMMFTIYPIVFQEKRGWNAGIGELPLIGMAVGAVIASSALILLSTSMRKKGLETKWQPENRLPLAMVGAVIFPLAMFWLAWSGNYNEVPWIIPTIAGAVLCFAIVFLFVSTTGYLTDTYLEFAASASAINTVVRSAAAAGAPLFTNQMFHTLTVGGAGSLLAGLPCLLAPIPFLFYRYGPALRSRSKWAPTAADRDAKLSQVKH